uniref:Uncharacterized protein n=1 Tax=Chlamydomonas leiostraca TaxID=1034604 RepID=A0A7S0R4G1_9CHLO
MTRLGATPMTAIIWKAFGLKVGKQAFLTTMECNEFDAVTVGDGVSLGGGCKVECVDPEGVVRPVNIASFCTCGANVFISSGVTMSEATVAGDKTYLFHGETLAPGERKQGSTVFGGMGSVSAGPRDLGPGNSPLVVLVQVVLILVMCPMSLTLASGAISIVVGVALAYGNWWASLLIYPGAMVAGILVQLIWVWIFRLVLMPGGHKGAVSVFSIRFAVKQEVFGFARQQFDLLQGTIFYNWIWMALGAKVGRGSVLLASIPGETDILEIGDHVVVEAEASVDGHSIEAGKFEFAPIKIDSNCWLGAASRLMPGTSMQLGSVLDYHGVAMKGEQLIAFTRWAGNPAVPVSHTGMAVFFDQMLAAVEEESDTSDIPFELASAAQVAIDLVAASACVPSSHPTMARSNRTMERQAGNIAAMSFAAASHHSHAISAARNKALDSVAKQGGTGRISGAQLHLRMSGAQLDWGSSAQQPSFISPGLPMPPSRFAKQASHRVSSGQLDLSSLPCVARQMGAQAGMSFVHPVQGRVSAGQLDLAFPASPTSDHVRQTGAQVGHTVGQLEIVLE